MIQVPFKLIKRKGDHDTNEERRSDYYHCSRIICSSSVEQLLRHKWKVPKKMLHEWRMKKAVQVNEEIVHWKKEVQHGDQLQLLIKRETNNLLPNNHPLQILYEDDHLYIVNKPAGMVTHPNESAQVNTLANIVANYFLTKEDNRKIRPIHRLDQHTTGALLFAKHALSQAILDRMLAEKAIKRTYWAIIYRNS